MQRETHNSLYNISDRWTFETKKHKQHFIIKTMTMLHSYRLIFLAAGMLFFQNNQCPKKKKTLTELWWWLSVYLYLLICLFVCLPSFQGITLLSGPSQESSIWTRQCCRNKIDGPRIDCCNHLIDTYCLQWRHCQAWPQLMLTYQQATSSINNLDTGSALKIYWMNCKVLRWETSRGKGGLFSEALC